MGLNFTATLMAKPVGWNLACDSLDLFLDCRVNETVFPPALLHLPCLLRFERVHLRGLLPHRFAKEQWPSIYASSLHPCGGVVCIVSCEALQRGWSYFEELSRFARF